MSIPVAVVRGKGSTTFDGTSVWNVGACAGQRWRRGLRRGSRGARSRGEEDAVHDVAQSRRGRQRRLGVAPAGADGVSVVPGKIGSQGSLHYILDRRADFQLSAACMYTCMYV